MPLNRARGRMFASVGWTWNPFCGCTHGCPYCYARMLRQKRGQGFKPEFRRGFFRDKMPDDGSWIFVGSMGDTFCSGVKTEWILKLLQFIKDCTADNKFLLQTKNPKRFFDPEILGPLRKIKDKVIVGTTIETNRETLGTAPSTEERYKFLYALKLEGFKTFLSCEPISDFDPIVVCEWITDIQPEAIEIGKENYTEFTTPPPEWKIIVLRDFLKVEGIPYVFKENLRYLEVKVNEE